ncbi:MAG TPA: XdhC family protein [Alcaligenes sp.]|nr:XdhC family protein [Alcaligenes sp.]HRL26681.1 XdhC family protein [Alcaligenes sp.]
MESMDVRVLRQLRDWREQGRQAILVTVVQTWGSSPRPEGSIMALEKGGGVVGSVSGGCIEDDLIRAYHDTHSTDSRLHGEGGPRLLTYGISADEAHRFGLPCGGTIRLLVEFDPCPQALNHILALLEQRHLVQRHVDLDSGRAWCEASRVPAALHLSPHRLSVTFGPAYRLLLIGGGQLSEYVATVALFNGFDVTVCDPRCEHIDGWSVAGVRVVRGMPDDEVIACVPDRRTAVVALTHDPKLDDMALLEALKSSAFYVGAIGSRRNNQSRRERLAEYFDLTAQEIDRLKGPIGLYVGSKTPAEIAVSIMAEIIAVKNGVDVPRELSVGSVKDRQEQPSA